MWVLTEGGSLVNLAQAESVGIGYRQADPRNGDVPVYVRAYMANFVEASEPFIDLCKCEGYEGVTDEEQAEQIIEAIGDSVFRGERIVKMATIKQKVGQKKD